MQCGRQALGGGANCQWPCNRLKSQCSALPHPGDISAGDKSAAW